MSHGSDTYDWSIAGNGAVGMTLAWHIHRSGQRVCLLTREEQPNPLKLQYQFNDEKPKKWSCPTQSQPGEDAPITRFIVATKAFSVADVLARWAPALAKNARVYLMQNGRDFLPESALLPSHHVHFIVNSGIASYRSDARSVVQTAMQPVLVGDEEGSPHPKPEVAADLDLLEQAGIHCTWTNDIHEHHWVKLAVNAAINPLTVIFDCNNGELLKNSQAVAIMSDLHKEGSAILKKLGVSHREDELRELIEHVISSTSENISSMLQDYREGSGRNELEYIMSPLIREAEKHEIDVPVLLEVHSRANARFKAIATPQ